MLVNKIVFEDKKLGISAAQFQVTGRLKEEVFDRVGIDSYVPNAIEEVYMLGSMCICLLPKPDITSLLLAIVVSWFRGFSGRRV